MKKYILPVLIGALVFVGVLVLLISINKKDSQKYDVSSSKIVKDTVENRVKDVQQQTKDVFVKEGDTLLSILTDVGIDKDEALEINNTYQKSFDVKDIAVGQTFSFLYTVDSSNKNKILINKIITKPIKYELATAFISNSYMYIRNPPKGTRYVIETFVQDHVKTYKAYSEPQEEATKGDVDDVRIEKIILEEGQKVSDVLRQFGITDEEEIERIIKSPTRNGNVDLDKEVKSGDVIRLSLSNGEVTKAIIKLSNGKKYIHVISQDFGSNGVWKIDSTSEGIHVVAESHNLVGDPQLFIVYSGKDKSRKHLDAIVSLIKSKSVNRTSFDLYDDYNAAMIAYIDWSSIIFSKKFGDDAREFRDEREACYNYQLEHSLVGTDNYGTVVFSNYELNDEYQENLRSGIYKKCDPEEFVDSYESTTRFFYFFEGMDAEHKRVIKEREGKGCQGLIKSKYRYVNSLTFEKEIDVDIKDNIYSISGVLNVESTNRDKAKQSYSCTYDNEKKEFVDWSVGKLELVGD